jgi:hypothetical protein
LAIKQSRPRLIGAADLSARRHRRRSHKLLAWACEHRVRYSVGYDLTEAVRSAILATPDEHWVATASQDGSPRPNGQVCEVTAGLDLCTWPAGSRVIVRRQRPHPARS